MTSMRGKPMSKAYSPLVAFPNGSVGLQNLMAQILSRTKHPSGLHGFCEDTASPLESWPGSSGPSQLLLQPYQTSTLPLGLETPEVGLGLPGGSRRPDGVHSDFLVVPREAEHRPLLPSPRRRPSDCNGCLKVEQVHGLGCGHGSEQRTHHVGSQIRRRADLLQHCHAGINGLHQRNTSGFGKWSSETGPPPSTADRQHGRAQLRKEGLILKSTTRLSSKSLSDAPPPARHGVLRPPLHPVKAKPSRHSLNRLRQ